MEEPANISLPVPPETGLGLAPLQSFVPYREGLAMIAGPCSAESEAQVVNMAHALTLLGIGTMRAGVWKPRTRPGSFEGMGEAALPWLATAKAETGIKTTVEVATPAHLEAALKSGVDIVWIGARTTVNPFAVQSLADALRGVDVPVLVKNPVNPDLELWQGAIERLLGAGVRQMCAVHRGFSVYEKHPYRNKPNWNIPTELHRRLPSLPIICDPSHIAGLANLVPEVARKAINLGFDGLMVEVHANPPSARSDREQQLTPAQMADLLATLRRPTPEGEDHEAEALLQPLREIVDEADADLLAALERRMNAVRALGELKREHHLAILQPRRWAEVVRTRMEAARKAGLKPEMVLRLLQAVHHESLKMQALQFAIGAVDPGPMDMEADGYDIPDIPTKI